MDFGNEPVTRDDIESDLEPVAGRKIVHRLTESEIEQYVIVCQREDDFATAKAMLTHDTASDMAARLQEALQNGFTGNLAGHTEFDATEVDAFFRSMAEYELSKQQFWLRIRLGRGVWNEFLTIAAGFTVVSLGPKLRTK